MKGLSTTHYLIKFLHFVHSALNKKRPHAVIASFIDLSKAFNRTDHSLVVQDLYDMHTPPWLLRIVFSYLSNRSMILTYNGAVSSQKDLPGGSPQGAFLGGLIFIIKFNGAFLRPPIPRPKSLSQTVKFVDDGSIGVSVDMKTCLENDDKVRPRPLDKHERTCQILPRHYNLLQDYITELEKFAFDNKIMIDQPKTNMMMFNRARKWDFPPEIFFQNGAQMNVVHQFKLVGVVVTDDLKWEENTKYICQKARRKLWLLRRMKGLNLTVLQMVDVYCKEVRSILEMCVPVWHSSLTKKQSATIERVQKVAFRIILGHKYTSYACALKTLKIKTLQERRLQLCKQFASKNLKSEFSLFQHRSNPMNTRSKSTVQEFKCNSTTFEKSSLPFLSKLVNTIQ